MASDEMEWDERGWNEMRRLEMGNQLNQPSRDVT